MTRAAVPADDDTAVRRTITVDGRRRSFLLLTGGPAPAQRAPAALVLVLHGSNQDAATVRRATGRSFDALAKADPTEGGGVVVAYLDGYRRHWNDARTSSDFAARREGVDDVAFVEAVIDTLAAEHLVDPGRVYAVGFSNGGQMVIRLAHQVPERFAGTAVIAATQPVPGNFDLPTEPATPMPVLLIHGTRDPLVPFGGGMASMWGFRKRGAGRSAPETAEYYAARNGITAAPTSARLRHHGESGRTSVLRTDYRQDGHAPVTLYTVEGGGHTVPNPKNFPWIMGRTTHDLVAAEAIAEFFALPPP